MKLLLTKILLFHLALALTVNLSAQHLTRNISLSVNKNFEMFYALYLSSGTDSMIMAKNYSGFPLVTQQDFRLKGISIIPSANTNILLKYSFILQ